MPTIADIRKQYPQYSDMSDGQLADALHSKFYSDMPRDQFDAKIGFGGEPVAKAPASPARPSDRARAAVIEHDAALDKRDGADSRDMSRALMQGFTFGAADELLAARDAAGTAIRSMVGKDPGYTPGDAYRARMSQEEGRLADFRERRPMTAAANEIGGGVANPISMVGGGWVGAGRSFLGAVGRSALAGAAAGGASGALSAEGSDRLMSGARGAAFGGGIGAALGPMARIMQSAGNSVQKTASPILSEVEAAKNAAYKAVDTSGLKFKPQAFDRLATGIEGALAKAGVNPMRHPRAASMAADIRKLADQGYAPTLTQLDQLRQVVNRDVVGATDKAERFMGRQIVDAIDKFIEGSPGGPTMTQARALNSQARKLGAVDTAVQKAKDRATTSGSGSNIDNAIRQNLRTVMEKTPGLTAEERTAFERAVRGSAAQNVARAVGKTSPLNGGLMGLGNAIMTGMNPATIPVALMTSGAKVTADAMTQVNVEALRRAIVAGGPAASAARKMIQSDPRIAQAVAQAGISIEAAAGRQMAPRPSVTVQVGENPSMVGYAYGPAGR